MCFGKHRDLAVSVNNIIVNITKENLKNMEWLVACIGLCQ